jgi:hypothetical protein
MNWWLLLLLIGDYSIVYSLGALALIPGRRHLNRLFRERFSDLESTDQLSAAERDAWETIVRERYDRTGYRAYEIAWMFFNYPSIIVLGAILRRSVLGMFAMYLVTGATYVALLYLLLR